MLSANELNKKLSNALSGDRSAQQYFEKIRLEARIDEIWEDKTDPYKYGRPEIEEEGEWEEEKRIFDAERAPGINF